MNKVSFFDHFDFGSDFQLILKLKSPVQPVTCENSSAKFTWQTAVLISLLIYDFLITVYMEKMFRFIFGQ